jgi:hypothetical protein
VAALRRLAEGLHVLDHPEFRMGMLQLGTRTTILALPDGTQALVSPGPLDAEALAGIRALGEVSHVVAPNAMHHLYLPDAARAFPQARVVAVRAVSQKNPELRVHEILDGALPQALGGSLELQRLEGAPKLDEHVLWHAPSRTLIGVDLAFNLHGAAGFTRFAMWLNGANDRFCVSRLARSAFIDDARAAGASVQRMLDAWDIERVVIAHGDVRESEGALALREAWAFAGVGGFAGDLRPS